MTLEALVPFSVDHVYNETRQSADRMASLVSALLSNYLKHSGWLLAFSATTCYLSTHSLLATPSLRRHRSSGDVCRPCPSVCPAPCCTTARCSSVLSVLSCPPYSVSAILYVAYPRVHFAVETAATESQTGCA